MIENHDEHNKRGSAEDRFQKYRRKQLAGGMVRITGYVHENDREKALDYLKRLRDAARLVV